MYRKYLTSNPYFKSIFFEQLRNMGKGYQLIETKKIPSKELKNDVKDKF